jgi:hypothetical protein
MTKKEKVLVSYFKQSSRFNQEDEKNLLKFIHTVNANFDGVSPFSWYEKHSDKKIKNKIKQLYYI